MTTITLERRGATLAAVGAAGSVLVGLVAATSPATALYAVGAAILCLIAVRSVVWLLAVFTVLTFPEQLPFGIAAGTVAKPLGALLVASWLLDLLRRSQATTTEGPSTALIGSLSAFVGFAAASALWASGGSAALSDLSRLVQMALLFAMVVSSVRSKRDLFILVGAYVAAATVTATYALSSGTSLAGRLTGGIANSNFLAAGLGSAMLLAFFVLVSTRGVLLRTALAASIIVNGVAFTMTQSRGGAIALAAGVVLTVILGGRWRAHAVAAGMLATAAGAAYFFALAAPAVRERLTNISAQGSSGRSDEWQIALRIFTHHPIGGAGLGNYSLLAPHYATSTLQILRVQHVLNGFVAHNTYLQILSELGLIGGVLFGAFLLVVGQRALAAAFDPHFPADPTAAAIARGVIVALFTLLAAYAFGSALFQKQLWILLALAAALPVLATRSGDVDAPR